MPSRCGLVTCVGFCLLTLTGCGQGGEGPEAPRSADALSVGQTSHVRAAAGAVKGQGGWATLKGRFVVDGTPPAPVRIVPNKDPEFCGKHSLVEEDVVIGKNNALANVAVWLLTKGIAPPDEAQSAPGPAVLDNKNCRFEPHVLVLRAGQPLLIKNSDVVSHNTMGLPASNPQFNPNIPAGGSEKIANLTRAERRPFSVSCAIHTWMKGWILLVDGPHAAASGPDGNFEIKNLPAGKELQFQLWQEKMGFVKNVTVGSAKSSAFGRLTITLKAGENDVGAIKVPSSALK